ncbi:hypothetical protein TCON_2304 [Astathelohania contejeani]|uniref:ISXO2-like transposase domain-containing protein n=1 Tax=Astathelohania contejeani TaxID=164912 RepID=A0ABQ7HWH3_9MICR|nr:hypothetical protein TCON_2304 [Thelohania contejeani]
MARNDARIGSIDKNGKSIIVEIDESLFFKRKYQSGRVRNGIWYVEGGKMNSKKAFIIPVEDISENAMYQIIHKHILPSTICITYEWRAYRTAFSRILTILHLTVNHSISFVNSENPLVHTNTIECFFSHTKKFLREKYSVDKDKVYEYLVFFI